jgi:SAM-dependent methyltransferase
MIAQARQRLGGSGIRGTVEFQEGDITALAEPSGAFDKVVATRVVINLEDWSRQQKALHELARVVRPGGMLLLSEATVQGWTMLNKFRGEWGLPAIPMPPFNRYLDEEVVIRELSTDLQLVELSNFSSTYFVGTRLLKPLLARAAGAGVDVSDPNSEWNRWFSLIPPMGDYGTQKLFVFRKPA